MSLRPASSSAEMDLSSTRRKLHSVARAPSGAERSRALTVKLADTDVTSIAKIMASLPEPRTLDPRTLVLVFAEVSAPRSFAQSLLAFFGRGKTAPRAFRCSALVARGYVDVGASDVDDESLDLVWGYAPDEPRDR